MRLKEYIKDNKFRYLAELISLGEVLELNETSDQTLKALRSVGDKLGLKVVRSDSLFDYLKRAGKATDDLVRLASLYLLTDISNSKFKSEIVRDAKKILKKLDKREIMAFIMQLDRSTLGITSHLRHITMSVFGVEITTYNHWLKNVDYLKNEIKNMKITLKGMQGTEDEIKALKYFENLVRSLEIGK